MRGLTSEGAAACLDPIDYATCRRAFMKTLCNGAVGGAILAASEGLATGPAEAQNLPPGIQIFTGTQVLNSLLNIAYLEASYYLTAVTGQGLGLSAGDAGTNPGQVTGGSQVKFTSPVIKAYAVELAVEERDHVEFLRSTITAGGDTPISRPALNISDAFNTLGQAAFRQDFNPYTSDTNFLLGAYIFEDVGVTA